MFKKMGLAAKLGTGFGVVIVIMLGLGGAAVFTMRGASQGATMLAEEYVPEVAVANNVERNSMLAMYAMRGWGLTEEESYYTTGQEHLTQVTKYLGDAQALADRAEHLVKLKDHVVECNKGVEEYTRLVGETKAYFVKLNQDRADLEASAQTYMQNSMTFLASQNEAFEKDLADRQQKVSLVSALVDIGTEARVADFKGQTLNDPALVQQAIDTLAQAAATIEELRSITKDEADLERIAKTQAAAGGYTQALQAFLVEFQKGAAADAAILTEQRKSMDENAATYVAQCGEFLKGQQEKLAKDMNERRGKINIVNDIVDLGNQTIAATWRSQAQRDPKVIQDAQANFDVMNQKLEELRKTTRQEVNLKQIDATKAAAETYKTAMNSLLDNWLKLEETAKLRTAAGNAVLAAAQATAQAGVDQTSEIATASAASLTRSSAILLVGVAVAAVFGLLAAFFIARSITGPINQVITGLAAGSEQVEAASDQVAQSSQAMAEGASEQASSLEETSASLEEMASMTRQNADNANQANTMAKEAFSAAEKGRDAMKRMSEAIGQIKNSSDETAKIIKTIDEIAFQTNLLALNAAVEAARAGDAGKGFAVVAEEVRNLAQRSAEAARNTSDLIEGAQQNADNGVNVSTEVGEILNQIAEVAQKVAALINEVTVATKEQSQGIDQVNTAVAQMDQVTQANAANSEEAASASEELSAQAKELNEMVGALTAIVGGAGKTSNAARGKAIAPPRSLSKKPAKALASAPHKSGMPAVNHGPHKVVNPDQVIPLDDDELSSF